MSREIDVRGLSCPQPMLLTKQAIDAGETEIVIIADDPVAVENVSRMAESCGYGIQTERSGGDITLKITKKECPAYSHSAHD